MIWSPPPRVATTLAPWFVAICANLLVLSMPNAEIVEGYVDAMVTVINDKGLRRKVITYLATPDYIDDSLKPYN